MSSLYSMIYLIVFITYCFISIIDSSGGADWNEPNIVIQGGQWVKIPDEVYDGSNLEEYPQPPPPYDDRWKKNDTKIIVLIASFRETKCKFSLQNLFGKAVNPSRIYIGIVQQNEPGQDEDCVYEYCKLMDTEGKYENNKDEDWNEDNCPYFNNIKVNRMLAADAKGPVYARALQAELVDDEDFCMQIDAHSDCADNWDMLMLKEWGKCENEYAVISTYPSNIKDIGKNSNKHWEMPHLCEASILGMGQVRNGRAKAAANLQRPVIAPLWAAGLSFSRCHAEKRVPNDINLKHVFNGEEFSRGARLWTHGYDIYSPSRAYIGTWYQSQKGNKGSWHVNRDELKVSNDRMGTLLKFPNSDQSEEAYKSLGFYGIGEQRTLEQYLEFSGVDTMNHKVDMSDKCIRKWIPWDDTKIKQEILNIDNHVVDHEKKSNDVVLNAPKNNLIMQGVHEIEQWVEKELSLNQQNDDNDIQQAQESNTGIIIFWLFCSILCISLIVAIIYRNELRKSANTNVCLKWKSEAHIV